LALLIPYPATACNENRTITETIGAASRLPSRSRCASASASRPPRMN